ncbi:hypothetical protein ACIP6X_34575 [Streptomyces coeruleorubidus]|uniref:hypothetical protein n=1 Tax=Streptomyces coeruleorubidus TaxID=116188 RepID=UPI00381D22E9
MRKEHHHRGPVHLRRRAAGHHRRRPGQGRYVRVGSALACTLFGFTLAATGLAPTINSGLASLAGLISSL